MNGVGGRVFQDKRTLTSAFSILTVPQLTWLLGEWGTGHKSTCIAGEENGGKAYGEDREMMGATTGNPSSSSPLNCCWIEGSGPDKSVIPTPIPNSRALTAGREALKGLSY